MLYTLNMISQKDFYPPVEVRKQARIGLKWYEEGHGGSGLVPKTIREARSIAKGEKQSLDKIRRMRAWFARHSVDKQSRSWINGTQENPSPSMVAWALWGGDEGRRWAKSVMAKVESSGWV